MLASMIPTWAIGKRIMARFQDQLQHSFGIPRDSLIRDSLVFLGIPRNRVPVPIFPRLSTSDIFDPSQRFQDPRSPFFGSLGIL